MKKFSCSDCGRSFEIPLQSQRPLSCPSCKSINIFRSFGDKSSSGYGPHSRGIPRGKRSGRGTV